jgi:hypothetical protein
MRFHPLLLASFCLPLPLAAQARAAEFARWEAPSAFAPAAEPALAAERRASTGRLILGGVIGGGVGLGAGALIGGLLGGGDKICGDDPCGFAEAVFGAVGGEVTLLPLGVHLANRRQGNYLWSLLASAGIAAGGIALSGNGDHGEVLIAVPVLQLVSSILIERGT